ncbi:kinetochore protein NNF1 [Metschnikowia aff. pulcherrima]|uniref:Kinetochore-associated protein n=1 Tax=Metschnikowia aff. pulcherrima TaxID=2163413 RepID=A0A4P6XH52_9ASCO|nr:kinetochore protein NNF1 [Metschnikowia aff. pulcherrima]
MEYDKVRYDRLNQVVKKAVEHTIKTLLMPDQVQKCFPAISSMEGGAEALETARKQIQKYFHGTCLKQVDHIFTERDVEQKLNELDEIIQLAQRARAEGTRKQIQVDLLTPEQLIQAGLGGVQDDTEKKLTMIYEQLRLDNLQIYLDLRALAEESKTVLSSIILLIEDLAGEVDDLRNEQTDEQLEFLLDHLQSVQS